MITFASKKYQIAPKTVNIGELAISFQITKQNLENYKINFIWVSKLLSNICALINTQLLLKLGSEWLAMIIYYQTTFVCLLFSSPFPFWSYFTTYFFMINSMQ
jgi:peroxiredoxin